MLIKLVCCWGSSSSDTQLSWVSGPDRKKTANSRKKKKITLMYTHQHICRNKLMPKHQKFWYQATCVRAHDGQALRGQRLARLVRPYPRTPTGLKPEKTCWQKRFRVENRGGPIHRLADQLGQFWGNFDIIGLASASATKQDWDKKNPTDIEMNTANKLMFIQGDTKCFKAWITCRNVY